MRGTIFTAIFFSFLVYILPCFASPYLPAESSNSNNSTTNFTASGSAYGVKYRYEMHAISGAISPYPSIVKTKCLYDIVNAKHPDITLDTVLFGEGTTLKTSNWVISYRRLTLAEDDAVVQVYSDDFQGFPGPITYGFLDDLLGQFMDLMFEFWADKQFHWTVIDAYRTLPGEEEKKYLIVHITSGFLNPVSKDGHVIKPTFYATGPNKTEAITPTASTITTSSSAGVGGMQVE